MQQLSCRHAFSIYACQTPCYKKIMREITPENAADYLLQTGLVGEEILSVEALGWGVSNLVLRVRTPRQWYVLKQSRPQLRTRELWLSDPERIFREAEAMRALATILPAGVVPRLLHVDRQDYWLLMEHAPPSARVWKGELLAARIDPAVAEFAGHILGLLHQRTRDEPAWREQFADRTIFWQLRTEPFYLRILQRHPDLSDAVRPLIQRLESHSEAICHGDFSPKNFLVWPADSQHQQMADIAKPRGFFTLVDYETVHYGDPAMDVGFFLSHLLLKALRLSRPWTESWQLPQPPEINPAHHPADRASSSPSDSSRAEIPWPEQICALTDRFWAHYRDTAGDLCTPEHEYWSRLHCGVVMLVRVDGTSPVDYLPEDCLRTAARQLARSLLLQPTGDWQEVLARLRELQRHLPVPTTN
jgi:aminoglycoside phosphotransferase (APT) family kinase protein